MFVGPSSVSAVTAHHFKNSVAANGVVWEQSAALTLAIDVIRQRAWIDDVQRNRRGIVFVDGFVKIPSSFPRRPNTRYLMERKWCGRS
jgi:hypothetical protein